MESTRLLFFARAQNSKRVLVQTVKHSSLVMSRA